MDPVAVTLAPGRPVAVTVAGRTLSVVNDPLLALPPIAGPLAPLLITSPDVEAGTVLVGFDSPPASADSAAAAVPPFSAATVPVPRDVRTVYLLYPGPSRSTGGSAPSMEDARTQISSTSTFGGPIRVAIGWSDAEGPLAVQPTGGILPRRLFDAYLAMPRLPLDYRQLVIPPSPATPVYDQDLLLSRGPFFRPHLAPSAVHAGRGATAYHALQSCVLAGDTNSNPFNTTYLAPGQATCRAILKIIVSLSGACVFVIGTPNMTLSGDLSATPGEVLRVAAPAAGVFPFDYGEGLSPTWDGSNGQWLCWSDTAGIYFNIMVLSG